MCYGTLYNNTSILYLRMIQKILFFLSNIGFMKTVCDKVNVLRTLCILTRRHVRVQLLSNSKQKYIAVIVIHMIWLTSMSCCEQ